MTDFKDYIEPNKSEFKGNLKDLESFFKKVDSASHAPTNEKHIKVIAAFSKNLDLISFLNNQLSNYFKIKNEFENNQLGFIDYDIKYTWYIFSLLLLAENEQDSIDFILDSMIKNQNQALSVVRRLFNLCKNTVYVNQFNKIDSYFKEINNSSKIYEWFKILNVSAPNNYDWEFVIRIQAKPIDGISYNYSDNLFLTLKAFEPLGNLQSYEFELSNIEKKIQHKWDDFSNDNFFNIGNKTINLKETPSLINLKDFINELEEIFNLKFEMTFNFSYFSKGFQNKNNIQKWFVK